MNKMFQISVLYFLFLVGCDKECVQSTYVNCAVSDKNFGKLAIGMHVEKADSILSVPYLLLPEIAPGSNGIGKRIWLKLTASDAHGEQVKIVVESRNDTVISKKIKEFSM